MKALSKIIIVGMLITLVACERKAPEEAPKGFELSDTLAKRIKIDTVKDRVVQNELKLTGKIVADENNVVKVYPLVGGYVQDVNVQLGDKVTKGQTLASIKSGEVADYERQLIDAQSDLLVAQKNLSVAEDMYAGKLYSEKELVNAKKELEKAQAELNRVKEIYSIYNIDQHSDYIVKAPISGYVIEKKINKNMQIRSDLSDNIFTVSELNDIYVLAKVYESDIPKIQLDYEADVTTVAYPDKVFHGKVCNIYNIIDPETKTLPVRIKIDKINTDVQLKPEMFAAVTLNYQENKTLPSVPAAAVVFDKGRNFVMVYNSRSNIETREIEVYKTTGDISYISSGLKAGDKIISKYQLYVYDELND
jgi:cobalt-zinc-cadmium efflux system membrane fusion protein